MAPLPEAILSLLPRQLRPRAEAASAITTDLPESPFSPRQVSSLYRRAPVFEHGEGARPATDFNNQGFLALFALIGAGMVIASIWFFFWAKNGGFKFQEGDWDDYKSTVLRRKGPDGKTLSNATKSTKLGGGSVVHGGSYGRDDLSSVGYTDSTGYTDKDEMREVGGHGMRGGDGRSHRGGRKHRSKDPELAEYRHEKPARVGGMNRQHDGIYYDYSNTEPSDVSRAPLMGEKEEKKARARAEKEKKQSEKANAKKAKEDAKAAQKAEAAQKKKDAAAEKKKAKSSKSKSESSGPTKPAPVVVAEPAPSQQRPAPSHAYSYVSGQDDNQTVYSGAYTVPYSDYSQTHSQTTSQPSQASYYDSYRPQNSARHSQSGSASNVRKPRLVQPSGEWRSQADSDVGTKAYPHYIPGLSSAGSVGVSESVSQVGGRRERSRRQHKSRDGGYRRGGRGRSDSLSDSE